MIWLKYLPSKLKGLNQCLVKVPVYLHFGVNSNIHIGNAISTYVPMLKKFDLFIFPRTARHSRGRRPRLAWEDGHVQRIRFVEKCVN